MKIKNIFILAISLFSLNACFVGDTDDLEPIYEPTLIEVLCQTPETSTFCKLVNLTTPHPVGHRYQGTPFVAAKLQFSGREGYDPVTGSPCAGGVETVFAPSDSAWAVFFAGHPEWPTLNDIPQLTLDHLVMHHIYVKDVYLGAKLFVDIENPECSEEQIVTGASYKMMDGDTWRFINIGGGIFPISVDLTSNFTETPIEAPDMATTDGAVYVIDKVLGPIF